MSLNWQNELDRKERIYLARNYQRQDSRYSVTASVFFVVAMTYFAWTEIVIPLVRTGFNLWVKYGNQVLRAFQ